MKKIFILFFLLLCPLSFVFADTKNSVNIYFFHSNTCSHCKAENRFLKSIEKKNNYIHVYRYEVHEEKNADKIKTLEDIYQIRLENVPVTVIGDTIFYGFSDETSENKFLRAISYYSLYGYQDKLGHALQVKTLSSYSYSLDNPSYSDYLEKINIKVLGILPIFTLDNSMNASILGVLSGVNVVFLGSLVILFLFLSKVKESKIRVLMTIYYFLLSYLGNVYLIYPGVWYFIILLFLFLTFSFLYLKNRKRNFLLFNLLLLLSLLATICIKFYFSSFIDIFMQIYHLYQFTAFDYFRYFLCYFFPLFVIYLILLCLLFLLIDKKFS